MGWILKAFRVGEWMMGEALVVEVREFHMFVAHRYLTRTLRQAGSLWMYVSRRRPHRCSGGPALKSTVTINTWEEERPVSVQVDDSEAVPLAKRLLGAGGLRSEI